MLGRSAVFAVAIAALTLALFLGVPSDARWQRLGENLVAEPRFDSAETSWRTSKRPGERLEAGRLRLELGSQAGRAFALQRVSLTDENYYEVRTRARLGSASTRLGSELESTVLSRMVLIALSPEGKPRFDLPHGAGELWKPDRGSEWFEHRRIVRVDSTIERGDFGVRLQGSDAWLELESPALFPVRQRMWFTLAAGILLCGWLWLIASGLRWTFRNPRPRLPHLFLGAVLAIIAVSSAIPGHWRSTVVSGVRSVITTEEPHSPAPDRASPTGAPSTGASSSQTQAAPAWRNPPTPWSVQKFGHFGAYALLALAAYLSLASRRITPTVTYCLTVAVLTEFVQFFSEGRTPTLNDIVIDLAGVALALAGIGLYRRRGDPTKDQT